MHAWRGSVLGKRQDGGGRRRVVLQRGKNVVFQGFVVLCCVAVVTCVRNEQPMICLEPVYLSTCPPVCLLACFPGVGMRQ